MNLAYIRKKDIDPITVETIRMMTQRCSRFVWRSKRNRKVIVGFIGLILLYQLFVLWWYRVSNHLWITDGSIPYFEPEITEDFPTIEGSQPRIPHIIHQTYKNEMVPSYYKEYIASFVRHNPDWQYYLWTDESARTLIAERHPLLLYTWDSYQNPIYKADALRYVVLYEFGGIYADMDFECLKPLDRLTYKYACIFPTEPFEMTGIQSGKPYVINNAVMLCRPKHPFLKQMIDSLPVFQPMSNLLDVAGPTFVTSQYILYNKLQQKYFALTDIKTHVGSSPYFYKGELSDEDIDAVYVPNSKFFFNSLDNNGLRIFGFYLKCNYDNNLRFQGKRACLELHRRDKTPVTKYAYLEHHWMQSYNLRFQVYHAIVSGKVNIFDIIRKCNIYKSQEKFQL